MTEFLFQDEVNDNESEGTTILEKCWRILIVDDDDSVHQVTRLVLADAEIEGRKLELVSAFSKEEAKTLLEQERDFSIAFVDVVMETDHAGLDLVDWIRNDLKNQSIRLILRTGQAGTVPEAKVIKAYDINDYKEKTDFTSGKMMTSVYAGIRAYRDIMTIQQSLDAFKSLIAATHDLLKINQLRVFGSAALNHLLILMEVESSALYIARHQLHYGDELTDMIIACTGKYESNCDNLNSADEISDSVKQKINEAFKRKSHHCDNDCFIGYYETTNNSESVLYIEFEGANEHFKAQLAEIYATNVALILEGLIRRVEIEREHQSLLYTIGDAIEPSLKNSDGHVKRVAAYTELMASKLNLSNKYIEGLKLAAPMHDIGNILIPEEILTKPTPLDDDEWRIVKTHTKLGGRLLARSSDSINQLAARIALHHHENWDGSGYPDGLKGESIPLEARIVGIADVFDVLAIDRCYAQKWSEDKIKAYMIEQKGIKFEAKLIDVLVEHYQEFIALRELT